MASSRWIIRILCIAVGLVGPACDGPAPGGVNAECVPNRAVACTCSGGQTGRKVCGPDGRFSACSCAAGDTSVDGGPPSDAAGPDADTSQPGGETCPEPSEPSGDRIFVAPEGLGSAAGTRDEPMSAEAAVEAMEPGDAVVFLDGTYEDVHLEISIGGGGDAPSIFRADNRHRAILESPPDEPAFSISDAEGVVIDGFAFQDPATRWFAIESSRAIQLRNLRMENGGDTGRPLVVRDGYRIYLLDSLIRRSHHPAPVAVNGSDNVYVAGNDFSVAPDAMLQFDEVGRSVVAGNVFHNGVGANATFHRTRELVVEDNLFTNGVDGPGADGASVEVTGKRPKIRFNRFVRNWGVPLHVTAHGTAKSESSNRVKIYHNVFDDSSDYGAGEAEALRHVVVEGGGGPYDTRFFNNIVSRQARHNGGTDAMTWVGYDSSNGFVRTNVFWGAGDGDPTIRVDGTSHSISDVEAEYTGRFEANALREPGFADPEAFDYRLASGDEAIDAGIAQTQTASAGSGTIVPVEDMRVFDPGHDFHAGPADEKPGDLVYIGDVDEPVRVVALESFSPEKIEISRSITWEEGDPIYLARTGVDPDLGVHQTGEEAPPTVTIETSKSVVEAGEEVTFRAAVGGSVDLETWRWQLGDGALSCAETVTHAYGNGGDYGIRLTATDRQGRIHRAVAYVLVGDGQTDPTTFDYNRRLINDYLCDGEAHPYTDGQTGRSRLVGDDGDGLSCGE